MSRAYSLSWPESRNGLSCLLGSVEPWKYNKLTKLIFRWINLIDLINLSFNCHYHLYTINHAALLTTECTRDGTTPISWQILSIYNSTCILLASLLYSWALSPQYILWSTECWMHCTYLHLTCGRRVCGLSKFCTCSALVNIHHPSIRPSQTQTSVPYLATTWLLHPPVTTQLLHGL